MTLDEIKEPVKNEMDLFEIKFKDSMTTRVQLLDKIMHYIVKRKGKQMRPLFVFLSAGVCGKISESTFTGATLIELLHSASLIHDDVVDNASERRGFFSINGLWKNKIAVLVGDFLLSRGLLLSVQHKEYKLLEIVSNAVRVMSEGELLQMEKARRLDIEESVYYEIIRQKTASLVASCCAAGAVSVGADEATCEKFLKFGENVGMAFQIKDDLFDYGEATIGKPVGIDIREKKMTLPLIYALSQATWLEKRSVLNKIQQAEKKPAYVQEIIQFVKTKGGLDYAEKKMNEYYTKTMDLLNTMPDSAYRRSLQGLVEYTIQRKY